MERLRRRLRTASHSAATLVGALILVLAGCSARESQALPAPPAAPTSIASQEQGTAQGQPSTKGDRAEEEKTEEKEKPQGSATSSEELSTVETNEEQREGLDEELDRSLSEFDALILREQEILEQRREASAASGGGGGAGDPGVADDSGVGEAASGSSGENGAPDRSGASADNRGGTGGSPDQPAGEPEESSGDGAPVSGDTGELSNGRVPPDVGDGSDDDIVARQLREAAMNEDDPELREKLWDEYRAYKFGTTGKKDDEKKKQEK